MLLFSVYAHGHVPVELARNGSTAAGRLWIWVAAGVAADGRMVPRHERHPLFAKGAAHAAAARQDTPAAATTSTDHTHTTTPQTLGKFIDVLWERTTSDKMFWLAEIPS